MLTTPKRVADPTFLNFWIVFVFALILVLSNFGAFGLKKVEVGKWEWYKDNIGVVSDAFFPSSDSINVITKDTLAQYSTNSGSIKWSRHFVGNVNGFISSSSRIVTLSNCHDIDVWSQKGSLLKHAVISIPQNESQSDESEMSSSTKEQLCRISLSQEEEPNVFTVSTSKTVEVRLLKNGAMLWSNSFEHETVLTSIAKPFSNDQLKIIITTLTSNSQINIREYDFIIKHTKKSIKLESISPDPSSSSSEQIQGEFTPNILDVRTDSSRDQTFCLDSEGHLLLIEYKNHKLNCQLQQFTEISHFESPPNKYPIVIQTKDGQNTILSEHSDVIQHYHRLSSTNVSPFSPPELTSHIQSFFVSPSKDNNMGLAVLRDHTVVLIRNGKEIWRRDESLAEVMDHSFVDLPVHHSQVSIEEESNVVTLFLDRLSKQFEQLKSTIIHLMNTGFQLSSFMNRNVQMKNLTQDRFGFHKVITLLTASGNVFGIQTSSGDILWSLNKQQLISNESPSIVPSKLFVTKSQYHTSDSVIAEITVIFHDMNDDSIFMVSIDAINGKVTSSQTFQGNTPPLHIFTLPETSPQHVTPCVLVRQDLSVDVFPERLSSFALNNSNVHYFHVINSTKGTASGYQLGDQVKRIWNHQFTNPIVGYAINSNPDNTGIQSSIYRRSTETLYKYLNPHLFAIATQGELPSTRRTRYIQIQVVDAITGNIVHNSVHTNAQGPCRILVDGNQVTYTYTNLKAKRQELSSLELFESQPHFDLDHFSSFNYHDVFAIGKSYVFPHDIHTLGMTQTSQGITIKNLLVGLSRNQVLMVPKHIFNARRPVGKPSTADTEEGLIPYKPIIEINPKSILTHKYEVNDIKSISSSPTHLESTTHILVVGKELFYSRLSPSSRYDMLTEDFNPIPVFASVAILVVGASVSKWFAKKQQLKNKWK